MSQTSLIGVGLYTLPDAARIIKVKPDTLRVWVKEARYTMRGIQYARQPVIQRALADFPNVLTFLELIELQFIKLFRSEGVRMSVIRSAAQRAAEMFNSDYPFAIRKFDTDGTHIFATLQQEADSEAHIQDFSRGQLAFEHVVKPFFRKLDYRIENDNSVVLRFWPLEQEGRVVLDPARGFGRPMDAETGVPTYVLYKAAQTGSGQTLHAVADWYQVPVEAVKYAIRFERSLQLDFGHS